jgi:poly(glycerol-phosphate) alpha-glucosyltransferase
MTLHNVWEDLRDLPDDALQPEPGARKVRRLPRGAKGERLREEPDGDGGVRQLVFRRDRSLVATEERQGGHRVVTTYTRRGVPGRRWAALWGFYRWMLIRTLPVDPTYVVVDSKSLVRFFATRPPASIRTLHVVHGAHLATDAADAHGDVVGRRGKMLDRLEAFDAVVVLTASQERDLRDRLGDGVRTSVIPNSTELPSHVRLEGRDPFGGVMLASLNPRKRVDHGIDAVDAVRRRTGRPVSLDVYGTGPEEQSLSARAAQVPGVRLHGHVPGAASRFATASFMLLTSTSEGMGLVLTEAMARGCLPVAYDIRYGPSDVITHGVDGFLVPSGDVDALAATIEHVTGLDEATLLTMRAAAVQAARRYDDAAVVRQWVEVLADVAERRGA